MCVQRHFSVCVCVCVCVYVCVCCVCVCTHCTLVTMCLDCTSREVIDIKYWSQPFCRPHVLYCFLSFCQLQKITGRQDKVKHDSVPFGGVFKSSSTIWANTPQLNGRICTIHSAPNITSLRKLQLNR